MKKYEEAINSYDKALALKPNSYYTWYSRGYALYNLKKYEQAIANYDQALASKSDDHYAWYNRGNALYDLQKYEQAINSYDQALKFIPNSGDCWYHKASCHALLSHVLFFVPVEKNNIDLAIESLRQAIKLSDQFVNYREWAKTNSDFDRIRKDPRFQALING